MKSRKAQNPQKPTKTNPQKPTKKTFFCLSSFLASSLPRFFASSLSRQYGPPTSPRRRFCIFYKKVLKPRSETWFRSRDFWVMGPAQFLFAISLLKRFDIPLDLVTAAALTEDHLKKRVRTAPTYTLSPVMPTSAWSFTSLVLYMARPLEQRPATFSSLHTADDALGRNPELACAPPRTYQSCPTF